jgi:hypothetical protein
MGYIVVVFSPEAAPGYCDLNHCPAGAFGPFETVDEAKSWLKSDADGFGAETWQPHVLLLSDVAVQSWVYQPDGRRSSSWSASSPSSRGSW